MPIEKRWKLHLCDAKRRKNIYFRNAIIKYGEENFSIYLLCKEPNNEQANNTERFYIQLFQTYLRKNGYNSTLGGEGVIPNKETRGKISLNKIGHKNPMYGKILSSAHRKKISDGLIGHKVSEETKMKIGIANRGRIFTEEQKSVMGRANLGKKFSEETRNKMSEARKGTGSPWFGKQLSEEHRRKLSIAHTGLKYPGRIRRKKTEESLVQHGQGNGVQ